MRIFGWTIAALFALVLLSLGMHACGWLGEAASVAREEFGPRGALGKYEWFIDAAKHLDARRQDIDNYRATLGDAPGNDAPRDERQAYRQRQAEVTGLIASYNALVADYNAASRKFNWSLFESREDRPALTYEEVR